MKPVRNALTLAMVGVGLSGCGYFFGEDGYFRDRGSDYQAATIEPRMTVPPELQSKPIGDLLPVPGEVRAGGVDKFRLPRPQGISVGAEYSDFSLQQNGGERWLLAQHGVSAMWPQVRQFFTEYQVPIARESSSLGEIETDWLRFEEGSSNALTRRLLRAAGPASRRSDQDQRVPDRAADVLPSTTGRGLQDTAVRTTGQEQRFRLRIEPGVQSGTSEIKVLHMQRSAGSAHADWPAASDNANLERALLAELESYLNQTGGQASVALSRPDTPPARRSSLGQDGAGNPVLNIHTDFNRAWAAVGQALAAADIRVDDLNRSAGVYYVNPQQGAEKDKPGFFGRLFRRGDDKGSAQRTEVRLTQVANRVQVTVEDSTDNSSDSDEARALLSRIHENLN